MPLVNGSTFQISDGVWTLTGCPSGFYLNAQQCQRCPALFYCTGGGLPATPCASGQYALPGAGSKEACFAAVFVVVAINVQIPRPIFSEVQLQFQVSAEERFKRSLARAANLSSDYVSLDIIQEGNDPGTTTVTSRVATRDAQAAAVVFEALDSNHLSAEFTSEGLFSLTLISLQVTACVPGYELSSAQTCQLCSSNYFCPGGPSGRQACLAGSFSPPGANSSSGCVPVVFVVISVNLPILPSNFTADIQAKFRAALALTAQVPLQRVVVTSVSRRGAASQLVVNSEVAADDAASAEAVRGRVDLTQLNANLMQQGLPKSASVLVTVADTGSQSAASGAVSLPAVLGGSIGGFLFLSACSVAGYLLFRSLRRRQARTAFLKAVRGAEAGKAASDTYFPPIDENSAKRGHASFNLRDQYQALTVLGKGSRGCVVKARKKTSHAVVPAQDKLVAIKIIVPKRDKFDAGERRQLEREAQVLNLVASRSCRSAVHAAEAADLPRRDDACWFIMEALDGETVAAELLPRGAAAASAVGVSACIQAARDVLAALKVLHSEGFVHCDVAPANIVHLAKREGDGFEYKLIDFGKAHRVHEMLGDDIGGAPAYRAPELFSACRVGCEADLWSLGATMFELVSGRPPFAAEGRAAAIQAGIDDRAPDVVDCLADGQRQAIDEAQGDQGLGRVIAKALERKLENRCCSSDLMTMKGFFKGFQKPVSLK